MLPDAGAVDLGRLIQILGDIHQDTGTHQHQVGNTDPDIDNDNQNPGRCRVLPEPDSLIDDTKLEQHSVHNAVGVKELGNVQQGNELGNRDGQHQDAPPQLLELDALLVDENGNQHAQEVVGEGGEECPHQSPGQDLTEGVA